MQAKLLIRNIPALIWQGLETLASRNNRSLEGEARMALQSWVEPQVQGEARSARRLEVSARLRALLEEARKAIPGTALKLSRLAEGLGMQKVEPVEQWFAGEVEPTLEDLGLVARYLGGSYEWLQHGDGSMFPVDHCRLSENAAEAVQALLPSPSFDKQSAQWGLKLTHLHLLREAGSSGRFGFVRQYENLKFRTFNTPHRISDEVGTSGRGSLVRLCVAFELLDALYKSRVIKTKVGVIKSYVLPDSEFNALMNGEVHPLFILKFSANDCPWWEDIWDRTMFPQKEYWPGWKSLCASLFDAVQSDRNLREESDSVRNRTHPVLQPQYVENGAL